MTKLLAILTITAFLSACSDGKDALETCDTSQGVTNHGNSCYWNPG